MWSKGSWFNHNTGGNALSQSFAFGDNNDEMDVFKDGDKTVIAVNNEYTNLKIMHKIEQAKNQKLLMM
jgi:secreted PhoX family phosphatase